MFFFFPFFFFVCNLKKQETKTGFDFHLLEREKKKTFACAERSISLRAHAAKKTVHSYAAQNRHRHNIIYWFWLRKKKTLFLWYWKRRRKEPVRAW
jgi:hypothetical protein